MQIILVALSSSGGGTKAETMQCMWDEQGGPWLLTYTHIRHHPLAYNAIVKQVKALQGHWAYRDTSHNASSLCGSLTQLSKPWCLVPASSREPSANWGPGAFGQSGIFSLPTHNLFFSSELDTTSNRSSLPLIEQIYISFPLETIHLILLIDAELKGEQSVNVPVGVWEAQRSVRQSQSSWDSFLCISSVHSRKKKKDTTCQSQHHLEWVN